MIITAIIFFIIGFSACWLINRRKIIRLNGIIKKVTIDRNNYKKKYKRYKLKYLNSI